jgi:MFS family permease
MDHLEAVSNAEQSEMDQIIDNEKNLTLWQAARAFPRIILLSLAACTAGLLFGYDVIVNGAGISMVGFEMYFGSVTEEGSLYLPSTWTALWTAMSALMQCLGSLAAAPMSDRVGRRLVIIGACFISAGGVAVQYTAYTRGMLLAGKMVNGLAIGMSLASATAWASEISPVRLRGPIQSGIVLLTVITQAFGLLAIRQNVTVLGPEGFRLVFAIQWAFCALTAVCFAVVPESPVWLILRGKTSKAKRSMRLLYGRGNLYEARLDHLSREIEAEAMAEHASGIGGYRELYRGSVLKRTLTVHLVFFGVGLAGSSFLAQSTYFLIQAGLPAVQTFDVSIGGFALAVLTIIASWLWIEQIGRRSLWLIGCAANGMVMVIIGALYYAPGSGPLWAIAILM